MLLLANTSVATMLVVRPRWSVSTKAPPMVSVSLRNKAIGVAEVPTFSAVGQPRGRFAIFISNLLHKPTGKKAADWQIFFMAIFKKSLDQDRLADGFVPDWRGTGLAR